MPTIRFVNEKKEIQVPVGANLRNEAIRAGVQVYHGVDKVSALPGVGLLRHLSRAGAQRDGELEPDGFARADCG